VGNFLGRGAQRGGKLTNFASRRAGTSPPVGIPWRPLSYKIKRGRLKPGSGPRRGRKNSQPLREGGGKKNTFEGKKVFVMPKGRNATIRGGKSGSSPGTPSQKGSKEIGRFRERGKKSTREEIDAGGRKKRPLQ